MGKMGIYVRRRPGSWGRGGGRVHRGGARRPRVAAPPDTQGLAAATTRGRRQPGQQGGHLLT